MIAPDAPVLTAKTSPCPGVEVYVPNLDVSVARVTVLRVADGKQEAVSGALKATASGDFVITDWLVPQDVASTYVCQAFDADGASILGASSVIEIPSNGLTWFTDPTDPRNSFSVDDMTLVADSFNSISRSRDRKSVYVSGLAQPFMQDWGLKAIESLPLRISTDTDDDGIVVNALMESAQLAIRTPATPFVTLPRLLYASIGQPTHAPDWAKGIQRIVWTLTVDEVQPVSKAVIRPLITWDDYVAAFPAASYTWDDVMAVYAAGTWTDAMRNPPNA